MITMTEILKQTKEALNVAHRGAIIVIFFACLVNPLEGRICTRVRSEQHVKTVKYPGECQQSFEASCGWFSMKTCVFNETVPCMKEQNMTVAMYRIVEDCCPGYFRNKAGKCVSLSELDGGNSSLAVTVETSTLPSLSEPSLSDLGTEGLNVTEDVDVTEGRNVTQGRNVTVGVNATDEDKGDKAGDAVDSKEEKKEEGYPDTGVKDTVTSIAVDTEADGSSSGSDGDDDDDSFFLGISHGAYAGIICGILFVACVALLTAVHYRKRRLQEEKKVTVSADQEAAQRQQMIPMEKLDTPSNVTT